MNIAALRHMPLSPLGFMPDRSKAIIRLQTAKEDTFTDISVIYGMKYTFQKQRFTIKMTAKYETDHHRFYEISIPLTDTRLSYVFVLTNAEGTFYYSESGLTPTYDFEFSYLDCFAMPYKNPVDVINVPEWTRTAVFYQIFIDRFARGNLNKDDNYITMNWNEKPTSKSFAGGDLQGIINKLPYLLNLGVNALYLTPIFLSNSNHKYDTIDYLKVDPMFGDEQTLRALINEAHKNGVKIVLDAVFNHCSSLHHYWLDVVEKGRASPYFDWFIIHGDIPTTAPINYETFAFVKYMPRFNTSNPIVQQELIRIALHYINEFDIDGWRLDVSDEVSHHFWRLFRNAVKSAKPDAIIIGENWHASEPWLNGDQFDGIMNYSFTKAALDYYANKSIDAEGLAHRLNTILLRYESPINQMMLNLLDSHDTHRFYTIVNENIDVLHSSLALLFMFVGMPCIYYGTEVPLIGGYDPDCRRTLPLDQSFIMKETFALVQQLVELRKTNEALQGENWKAWEMHGLLYFQRQNGGKLLTLILNQTNESIRIKGGNILISNLYFKQYLQPDGFIITDNEHF